MTEKIFLEYVRPGVAEFLGTCLYLFLAVCIVGSGTEFTPLIIGLIITGTIIALLDIRYALQVRFSINKKTEHFVGAKNSYHRC